MIIAILELRNCLEPVMKTKIGSVVKIKIGGVGTLDR